MTPQEAKIVLREEKEKLLLDLEQILELIDNEDLDETTIQLLQKTKIRASNNIEAIETILELI